MAYKKPKKPAQPYRYYNDKDDSYFNLFAREFSDNHSIAKITLYRVNMVESKTHKLYGTVSSGDKKFMEPLVLNVSLDIEDETTDMRSTDGILHQKHFMQMGVYKDELTEKNCVINRGDFYKYHDGEKERNYEISDVSFIDTNNSLLGYKPFYITIKGVLLSDDFLN